MLSLKPFQQQSPRVLNDIVVLADLSLLGPERFELLFKWIDPLHEIVFADQPSGRQMGLWQNTCFEVFVEPVESEARARDLKLKRFSRELQEPIRYYEANFSAKAGWNVFGFTDYRLPQPPTELSEAHLVSCEVNKSDAGGTLRAVVDLKGAKLSQVKISLCAVIVTRSVGTTYWSFKHADQKPNFHHFDSFIIERTVSSERF